MRKGSPESAAPLLQSFIQFSCTVTTWPFWFALTVLNVHFKGSWYFFCNPYALLPQARKRVVIAGL